jgi:hypothetical protein
MHGLLLARDGSEETVEDHIRETIMHLNEQERRATKQLPPYASLLSMEHFARFGLI